MERVTASRLLTKELHGSATLPDICIRLRQQACGASDPWPPELAVATVNLLRERLAVWLPSHPTRQQFDDAVKRLVEITVEECGRALKTGTI